MMQPLETALLDLLHGLRDSDIDLIIGGGYGLYLKTNHILRTNQRTLLQEQPEARSTNDLDLILRPELLIESARLQPLSKAIAQLGYQVIPEAAKYQFVKQTASGNDSTTIKIDLLTGPQSHFDGTKVKADARRARPNPKVGIHAHPIDEALSLNEGLTEATLEGQLSSGDSWTGRCFLPHPFTYLMMKLFAFRDRCQDAAKDFGRYHALDLYTILATTTEGEWDRALQLRDQYQGEPYVAEAGQLVSKCFSDTEQLGLLRLRESSYYRKSFQLQQFISALGELFPRRD